MSATKTDTPTTSPRAKAAARARKTPRALYNELQDARAAMIGALSVLQGRAPEEARAALAVIIRSQLDDVELTDYVDAVRRLFWALDVITIPTERGQ